MGTLRRAQAHDVDALVQLRALMHQAMGDDPDVPGWRPTCREALLRRLADRDRFAAFVVEVGGAPVAGGVGWLEEHLPSPHQLDGRRGHIASMSTDPAHRRRGHGHSVLASLLGWFDDLGVSRVDLRATPDGLALYEAAGFRRLGGATMARTAAHVRPGARVCRLRQEPGESAPSVAGAASADASCAHGVPHPGPLCLGWSCTRADWALPAAPVRGFVTRHEPSHPISGMSRRPRLSNLPALFTDLRLCPGRKPASPLWR